MGGDDVKEVTFWPGNPLSYTTTRIVCYFNETILGNATGYIHRFAGYTGLITNWHVVAGRSPIDGLALDKKTLGIPNRISFHVAVAFPQENGNELVHFREFSIPLCGSDGKPFWVDAKADDNQRDVALIPLDPLIPELKNNRRAVRAIDGGRVALPATKKVRRHEKIKREEIRHFFPPIGSEVFVLGYPKGISSKTIFPIWKRASIASEPQIGITLNDVEHDDAFYIDALTKGGMSGSPVVYFAKPNDEMFTEDNIRVTFNKKTPVLIGVYAGRDGVSNEEYELALGRVWKVSLIEDLFARPPHPELGLHAPLAEVIP